MQVEVEKGVCVAIREALRAGLSPDHLEESKKWLKRRKDLMEKGCDCGVKSTWTAGETETEVLPGDGGPGSCRDPRRKSVRAASLSKVDVGGAPCGPCKDGFIPFPGPNGEECLTPDQLGPRVSCPGGSVPEYDSAQGTLGCFCPSGQPVWDEVNQVCFSPRRARGRRPPPGRKCHFRPDGTHWHCEKGKSTIPQVTAPPGIRDLMRQRGQLRR